jgi:hypothetical protein
MLLIMDHWHCLLPTGNRQLFNKEEMVSDTLKKIPAFILKIFALVGLLVSLAAPAPAQEQQGSKVQTPSPAPQPAPAPRAMRKMRAPMEEKDYEMKEEQSRKQKEALQQKKGTGKIGGQEIRAKEGEEDK